MGPGTIQPFNTPAVCRKGSMPIAHVCSAFGCAPQNRYFFNNFERVHFRADFHSIKYTPLRPVTVTVFDVYEPLHRTCVGLTHREKVPTHPTVGSLAGRSLREPKNAIWEPASH